MEIPVELLPVPKSLFDFTFALIGWGLGSAFGGGFDEEFLEKIKENKAKWIICRILHFFHHYWIGLLLLVFCGAAVSDWSAVFGMNGMLRALYWIGYGLFVEDGQYHIRNYARRKVSR